MARFCLWEKKDKEKKCLMSHEPLKESQQNEQVVERNEIQCFQNWGQERCYRNHLKKWQKVCAAKFKFTTETSSRSLAIVAFTVVAIALELSSFYFRANLEKNFRCIKHVKKSLEKTCESNLYCFGPGQSWTKTLKYNVSEFLGG